MFLRDTKPGAFKGKRVLLTVDYNVDIINGKIQDVYRITATFPTIRFLLRAGAAQIILLSYLGRPDGHAVPSLTLKPVTREVSRLLRRTVRLAAWRPGAAIPPDRVVMLENIRFFPGEEKNDARFAHALSRLGDAFVNDGFSASHRAHASIVGLPRFLPSYYGFQFEREVTMLSGARTHPARPLLVVLGGAKLETKLPLIRFFLKRADRIALGGKILNEFLAEQKTLTRGWSIAERRKLLWPVDFAAQSGKARRIVWYDEIADWGKVLDMGPSTLDLLLSEVNAAKTVIWNGPLGKFEDKRFRVATDMLARHLVAHRRGKRILVGGGDTLTVLEELHALGKFDHVSTGGGAMLEFLARGTIAGYRGSRTETPHSRLQ